MKQRHVTLFTEPEYSHAWFAVKRSAAVKLPLLTLALQSREREAKPTDTDIRADTSNNCEQH